MVKTSHMTCSSQSECFSSAWLNYAKLKFCLWHWLQYYLSTLHYDVGSRLAIITSIHCTSATRIILIKGDVTAKTYFHFFIKSVEKKSLKIKFIWLDPSQFEAQMNRSNSSEKRIYKSSPSSSSSSSSFSLDRIVFLKK